MNVEELFYKACKRVGAVKYPSVDHCGEIYTAMGLKGCRVWFKPPHHVRFVVLSEDLRGLDAMQEFTKAMRDIKAEEQRTTLEFNTNSPYDTPEAKEVWLAAAEFYKRSPVEHDDDDYES